MEKSVLLNLEETAKEGTEKLVMMPYAQEDVESHSHKFFELTYITGGTATQVLNGIPGTVQAGDYFILDFDSVHSYQDTKNFELINCLFMPEIVDDTLAGCRSFEALVQGCLVKYYSPALSRTSVNRVFQDTDGRILDLLMGMIKEYEEKKEGYLQIYRGRLIEILVLTMRRILKKGVKNPAGSVIGEIMDYIDGHYTEKLSLSEICQAYHFNLQYISRKFKNETGLTFREYLQKVRIEKSCFMLQKTDLRIMEISHAVGYEDVKFFNMIFKKLLQMSPSAYRKMSR